MLRRLQTLTLLASGVVVAACGDGDRTPTSPELQVGTGPACSPTNVKKYARDLAGSTSPLYNIAQQFTTQNANKTPGGTTLFFDLAAEAANLARPGELDDAHKTALANLLIQGIACADVIVSDVAYTGFRTEDVANFFAAAGLTGGLEVRGRPITAATENARVLTHNVGGNGSAGIGPPPSKTFADWYGGRVLFYGFPIPGYSSEAPPSLNNRVAFEWFTVRPSNAHLSETLRGQVAVCVLSQLGGQTAQQLRVQHEFTILPIANFAIPCDNGVSLLERKPMTSAVEALAWLRDQLLPEPLQATSILLGTSPGSSASKLSPLEVINPGHATLTYDPGPVDGQVNQPLNVKVHAEGDGGTDWEGLLIEVKAQDNNGKFVAVTPNQATTDASGFADFTNSKINKSGVYQLLAYTVSNDPDLSTGQFAPDSVLSGNFLQRPR